MNQTYWQSVWEFKRCTILRAVERNGGNKAAAARELGIHRNTLDRELAQPRPNGSPRAAHRKPPNSARIDRMLEIVSQHRIK